MIETNGSDQVPHVVINRDGRANTLTIPLLDEMAETLKAVIKSGAEAIVITGANQRFCAGADLEQLTGTPSDVDFDDALGRVTDIIAKAPVAVIAAVERYAFGAAVDLAWSCDVVVAAEDVRVAIPATTLGILYNPDALRRLHARVGSRILRQLLVAGRELSGADLADVVVSRGQTLEVADRIAHGAAVGAPAAIKATKRVLDDFDHGRDNAEDWEALRIKLLAAPARIETLRLRGSEPSRSVPGTDAEIRRRTFRDQMLGNRRG